jgi:curli production assembly/transport component CsgG/holdfast attachment protein HfaB
MKKILKPVSCVLLLSLSGCGKYYGATDNYVTPIGTSMVTQNSTVYSKALECLGTQMVQNNIVPSTMTVGRILDYTGKDDLETGKRLTQGAALMAMSALGKAKVPQVERFDTSITEFDLKMKDNKLVANSIPGDQRAYQPIIAGSLPGSKYTLIGGITELNYNIRSNDVDAMWDIASGGLRFYVMNVAMDVRLVETETLKVVATRSYQKQIIGREIRAGVFKFFDNKLLDVGVGERSLEPMQLAVRSISELAVYDLLNDLYQIPKASCDAIIGPVE